MSRGQKLRLCWVLLGINLAVIWGNSLLPGELSGAFSEWVKSLLAQVFPAVGDTGGSGSGLLRKAAHFLEFTSLGLLLSWLWGILAKGKWHGAFRAVLSGFAAACVDEAIQRFVPGRHGCVTDVGIDTAGVVFGLALFLAGCKLRQKKNDKILEETK